MHLDQSSLGKTLEQPVVLLWVLDPAQPLTMALYAIHVVSCRVPYRSRTAVYSSRHKWPLWILYRVQCCRQSVCYYVWNLFMLQCELFKLGPEMQPLGFKRSWMTRHYMAPIYSAFSTSMGDTPSHKDFNRGGLHLGCFVLLYISTLYSTSYSRSSPRVLAKLDTRERRAKAHMNVHSEEGLHNTQAWGGGEKSTKTVAYRIWCSYAL